MTEKLTNQSGEQATRDRLVDTIMVFSRQYYQSIWVNNPGSDRYKAFSRPIFETVPALDFIVDGDLALRKGLGKASDKTEVSSKIVSISENDLSQTTKALDLLIDVSSIMSFSEAMRLKSFLPVRFPDTHEGFRVLKEISVATRKHIQSGNNIAEISKNISTLSQTIRLLEDEIMTKITADPVEQIKLRELASKEARVRFNDLKTTNENKKLEGLIDEIIAGKISRLRDIKITELVDGEIREFSQLDTMLYTIIEERKLLERMPEAKKELRAKIRQKKEEVTTAIIKRRVLRKVAGLILSDSVFSEAAAKLGGVSISEILSLKDDQGFTRRLKIAQMLVESPRSKLLKFGITKFPDIEKLSRAELQKFEEALASDDPFLFIAQLDEKEFDAIRTRIPNIFRKRMSAENKAVFALAKTQLQENLADDITDEEIVTLLSEKIFREMLRKIAVELLDRSILSLGIDPTELLKAPMALFDFTAEIMAKATLDNDLIELYEPKNVIENRAFFIAPQKEQIPKDLRLSLDELMNTPETKDLGKIALKEDIESSEGPFRYFPEYKTQYPDVVVQALGELYAEYNQAFADLVQTNIEWDSDYQFALGGNGVPVNYFVQIDMLGLTDSYLKAVSSLDPMFVKEDLRNRIFEIENSVAMYQLLMKNFSENGSGSNFDRNFRAGLDALRARFSKPIALLAVTDGKYALMRSSEFGKPIGTPLTDSEVFQKSGFDRFFGPEDFKVHIGKNGGVSDFLLYVRSSDPVAKLRNPNLKVEQPLLNDPSLRKVIKANSLTFNVDRPGIPFGSMRSINDTKAYMLPMGMAFPLGSIADLKDQHFGNFLISRGIDPSSIMSGTAVVRAKPMQTSYGAYGHLRGQLNDREFKQRLASNLRQRGPYVIQPELNNAIIINSKDGESYAFIDRNFFSFVDGTPRFMGGERTLMPINSGEVKRGRIHGNKSSITAEVF